MWNFTFIVRLTLFLLCLLLTGCVDDIPEPLTDEDVEELLNKSDGTISPTNLPPSPPQNVQAVYQARSLFNNKYDVTISWSPNQEANLAGYQIYSTTQGGGDPILRKTVDRKKTSVTLTSEDPILEGQDLVLRQYFVTAFTLGPDGSRNESPMVAAPLPQ